MFLVEVLFFGALICLVTSESEQYRLSIDEATPLHYYLKIQPNFENETFHGEVSIYVATQNYLNGITLHSSNLSISQVSINRRSASYSLKPNSKLTVFYPDEPIQPGEHFIQIKYTGWIHKTLGFIKATYEMEEKIVYLYVTDLEPTRARTVLPCFDEPYFKAQFNVRLISPNGTYQAISNMPEIGNFTTEDNSVVYDFATSVKMSTYLLSFAFTDAHYSYYEQVMEYKGRKIPIRIHTVNASKKNNEFAFNCTKTALEFYSYYTNISYPLSKLDMIEYRRNLSAATENWGLITFRQGLLTPSLHIYNEYQIRLVIFHELSHFWFGNLVTNKWWDDIWLQEGFATYMSFRLSATDGGRRTVLDEMKVFNFNEYLEEELYSEHPAIVSYLPKESDIDGVFTDIAYYKGAAVLLLLETLVGEEKFQQIVMRYIEKFSYSTATTNDFIATVENVVPNMQLRSFLESYLYQRKYPTIHVDVDENSTYLIHQEPCENVNNTEIVRGKWTIPITYQTDLMMNNISRIWLDRDQDHVRLALPDAKWIVFDPRGIGIYRTVWSSQMWERIIGNFDIMPVSTTESIMSDIYYGFRTSKVGCDVFIRLMGKITEETKAKWKYCYFMLEHLKENLYCNNYKEEADVFWKYFEKRLVEKSFQKNHLSPLNAECDTKYIQKTEKYLKNLDQCAQFIRENLSEKDSNAIKPIL